MMLAKVLGQLKLLPAHALAPKLLTAFASCSLSVMPPPPYDAFCINQDLSVGEAVVTEQGDFLGSVQLGLGLEDTRPDPTYVDPQEVREELRALLATARAAREMAPWDRRMHRYHQVVFPQMANWLPADEADQLRFEFARELERIEALLAA